MTTGLEIRCTESCCDKAKKLAEISSDESVFFVVKHHGISHTGFVSAKQLIYMLSGTVESSAIHFWMRGVLVGSNI